MNPCPSWHGYWALPLPGNVLGHSDRLAEVMSALSLLTAVCAALALAVMMWRYRRLAI